MQLHALLAIIADDLVHKAPNMPIAALSLDSREVATGTLFFALPGQTTDGRAFIDQSIAAGASVILYEQSDGFVYTHPSVVCLGVTHLLRYLGDMASLFYGHPSHDLDVYAVTGTNGKSSCVHYLAQLLDQLGQSCWVMGTLGSGFVGDYTYLDCTTPDVIAVHRELARARDSGALCCAMEVSSHALSQARIASVVIRVAVLTNISHDHLDYHKDMDAYVAAKASLFPLALNAVVLNADSEYGRLFQKQNDKAKTWTYAIDDVMAEQHIGARIISLNHQGFEIEIHRGVNRYTCRSSLLARFNIENILAVVSALCSMGYNMPDIVSSIESVDAVCGRMQSFTLSNKVIAIVDYAHTPDALEKTLMGMRVLTMGKLWCVFGCGGDRDKLKRPLMTETALQYADQVVLTSDNPRGETLEAIFADMLYGHQDNDIHVEGDRARAIDFVLSNAKPNDMVLVAGKGHEQYQVIADKKIKFSDIECIRKWL